MKEEKECTAWKESIKLSFGFMHTMSSYLVSMSENETTFLLVEPQNCALVHK